MRFTLTGHLGLSGLISCAQGPHVAHGYLIRQYSFRLKTEVLTPPLDLFSLSGQFSLTLFCVCPFFFFFLSCCTHPVKCLKPVLGHQVGGVARVRQGVVIAGSARPCCLTGLTSLLHILLEHLEVLLPEVSLAAFLSKLCCSQTLLKHDVCAY